MRLQQQEARILYLKEHEGHEHMHAEMLLIMFITMILAQVFLFVQLS